ncbi:zinc finger protein 25-like isoform X1 [Tenebrio molitor]|jgi:KRAB domain-containing zinc finger protein|uniref:zinc finger protein 25-like isoform X1 n=1 Tax=Tenebrio molitor TaxID=7067 RepID=UPI0036247FDB
MFGNLSHSVFEAEIKIEPISFYGCSSSESEAKPPDSVGAPSAPADYLTLTLQEPPKKRKPQACKICGKILSSTSSYYVHMKLHSGNKPFQCTQCDACFCRKPYLEVHLRTHTGERPFQCDVCEKRFTQKSSLNTHKRVHTGLRPYGCELCEKKFAVKSYLVAHRWSHVSDGLSCPECHAVFTTKSQFVQHVKGHNSRRGYECALCQRRFVRDSYLIRHQNKVHKNGNA